MRYPRLDSTLGPHNSYVVDSAQPSFISYLLKFALLLCIATLVVVLVVGVLRFGIVEAFMGASSICWAAAPLTAFGCLVEFWRKGRPVVFRPGKDWSESLTVPTRPQLGVIVGCILGGMQLAPQFYPRLTGYVLHVAAGPDSLVIVCWITNLLRSLIKEPEPWAAPPAKGEPTPGVGGWAIWTRPLVDIQWVYNAFYLNGCLIYSRGIVAFFLSLEGFIVLYCLSGEVTVNGIPCIRFPQYDLSQAKAICREINAKWGLHGAVPSDGEGVRVVFSARDRAFFRAQSFPSAYAHLRPPA